MRLEKLYEKKKKTILSKWFEAVVKTYPPETARFLKAQNDPFANPVGQTTINGLEGLFDQLMGGMSTDAVVAALDPIIRIRAIQSFSPSRAVGFLFDLKKILADESGDLDEKTRLQALRELDGRIDRLALAGFDTYMRCREKVFQLQANESRNQFYNALHRAGLMAEEPTLDGAMENAPPEEDARDERGAE